MSPDAKSAPAIASQSIIRQLHWRAAVKKFDPTQKIAPHHLTTLEHAMVLAPSSFGLQPWKFVVVSDPAVREKLKAASHGQPKVTDASHFIVLAARKGLGATDVQRYIDNIAKVRKAPPAALEPFKQMMLGYAASTPPADLDAWCKRQVYIALGVLISTAALLGIDAGPMEGFEADKVDEILGLTAQGFTAAVCCAVGYRAADDEYSAMPKVRFPVDEVVTHV